MSRKTDNEEHCWKILKTTLEENKPSDWEQHCGKCLFSPPSWVIDQTLWMARIDIYKLFQFVIQIEIPHTTFILKICWLFWVDLYSLKIAWFNVFYYRQVINDCIKEIWIRQNISRNQLELLVEFIYTDCSYTLSTFLIVYNNRDWERVKELLCYFENN